MGPYPMVRQKTMGPPLILRDVVPESAEGRPREQHISSTIEQVVECSTHLVQRASRVEGGEKKVEVRANVDLLATDPFSGDGEESSVRNGENSTSKRMTAGISC